ncbi:MAG: hypothetical protein OET44_14525 [Gammaproteobacteria bacterium]|nr:hypothetical protein [Gammaproteobacteria bacterium]
MPIGQWFRISGDRPGLGLAPTPPGTRYLQDNDPAADPELNPARSARERLRRWLGRRPSSPWQGRSGFPSITEAWNGAVLATRFGKSGAMVVFGGGHNDYFGADLHAFDLGTRQWSRIADGYISHDPNAYGKGAVYPHGEYPDGSPLPPHTYEYVQYDPEGNDYILFKGQLELGPDVKAVAIAHMFNFDTMLWRRSPRHSQAVLNSGGCTVWDAKRRVVWGNSGDAGGGNAFLCFDPQCANADGTFGSWGEMFANKLAGEADHNAMAMDPARDIIVVTAHARNALCAIDPSHPGQPLEQLRSSANQPHLQEYAALEYAPNLHAFVYFSARPGAVAYRITPPDGASWNELTAGEWRWETLHDENNDLDPVTDAGRESAHEVSITHTFGRFRVATYGGVDVALLVRHIDSPVYAMRLT